METGTMEPAGKPLNGLETPPLAHGGILADFARPGGNLTAHTPGGPVAAILAARPDDPEADAEA